MVKEHEALKELLEYVKVLRVEREIITEKDILEAIRSPSVL